MNNYQTE